MSAVLSTMERWGFDTSRLAYAFRVALAGCVALVVAWLIGLEHPQWSAMTVWAASQPLRGMLIEKSLFRGAGTLVGSVVGVVIVALAQGDPLILTLSLAAWVGFCTGVGNLLRGFVAYGALLCGYTASMVALLGTASHTSIFALGVDRFATVMVGVITALLAGWLFALPSSRGALWREHGQHVAGTLRVLAGWFAAPGAGALDEKAALAEIARLDQGLDAHDAGSLPQRQYVRRLRAMLIAEMDVLFTGPIPTSDPHRAADALQRVAEAIERNDDRALAEAVATARAVIADQPAVQSLLDALLLANDRDLRQADAEVAVQPPSHRDWIGARHAALRTLITLLAVGAVWVTTGWVYGPYMMLSTAVLVSLFSTWENPLRIMVHVFFGQLAGALMFLIVRWLVWPSAGSEADLVFLMMPFILLGALPLAHRKTALGSFDFNLVFLLLAQPHFPLAGDFQHTVAQALAVVAAPVLTLLAFRLLFPTDAAARARAVITMMLNDVVLLARRPDPQLRQLQWNARYYHRLLRLYRWVANAGDRGNHAVDKALGLFDVAGNVFALHQLEQRRDVPESTRRIGRLVLRRIANLEIPAARDGLMALAERLDRAAPGEGAVFRAGAEGLSRIGPVERPRD